MDDVSEKSYCQRGPLATAAGLRGAFALPVLMGERVLGAIEFFSRDARHPDKWLLQVMVAIGSQIGQLMARRAPDDEARAAHDELEVNARELPRFDEELQEVAHLPSPALQVPLRTASLHT